MNIPIAPLTPALGDFVFRSADRMRIDGCANAIAREGLSLSLQCEHEALLDHYLGLLLKRLRQDAPDHSIEVYFPTNTDSLLGRFNEALARQSVQQATSSASAVSKAQIWIVHDAQALPEAEVQLLARLIQNFPGANIRAILLMTGPSANHNQLSAFGRKILRWDIEAPSAEQAQAALELARGEGRLLPVQQLLRRINRQNWADDTSHPEREDAAAFADPPTPAPTHPLPANQVKQRIQTFHGKGQEAIAKSTQMLRQWDKNHTRLLLWVLAALTLSTATMLWLQPEAFGIGTSKNQMTTALPIEWPEPDNGKKPAPPSTSSSVDPAASIKLP